MGAIATVDHTVALRATQPDPFSRPHEPTDRSSSGRARFRCDRPGLLCRVSFGFAAPSQTRCKAHSREALRVVGRGLARDTAEFVEHFDFGAGELTRLRKIRARRLGSTREAPLNPKLPGPAGVRVRFAISFWGQERGRPPTVLSNRGESIRSSSRTRQPGGSSSRKLPESLASNQNALRPSARSNASIRICSDSPISSMRWKPN